MCYYFGGKATSVRVPIKPISHWAFSIFGGLARSEHPLIHNKWCVEAKERSHIVYHIDSE